MSEVKKKHTYLFVFLVVVIIAAVCTGGYFTYLKVAGTRNDFVANKTNLAMRLYKNITEADLEGAYPETPEAVADLNGNIVLLTYGAMIVNEEILEEILSIQRNLFAPELLESTSSAEAQLANVKSDISELTERGFVCVEMNRFESIYSEDRQSVTIHFTQILSPNSYINWYYKLVKADGRWKILGWVSDGGELGNVLES